MTERKTDPGLSMITADSGKQDKAMQDLKSKLIVMPANNVNNSQNLWSYNTNKLIIN